MEPEKKSNGSLVGLVIIVIILIIGGIYIWQSNQEAVKLQNSQTQSEALTSQDAAALDALELNAEATDTSTGVDANAVY